MATDHDLLIRIDERTERLEAAVLGNGQPGLVTRLAKTEQRLDEKDKTAMKSGGTAAVITAGVLLLLRYLGIEV